MTEPVPLPVARNAEPTWDVAIVGAGLCALALARTLPRSHMDHCPGEVRTDSPLEGRHKVDNP